MPVIASAVFTTDPVEARAIAKEAYLYAFPIVESYKTLYAQAVDTHDADYRAPFNQLACSAHDFTPADANVLAPNVDVAQSTMWMDLRAEPLLLTLPEIDSHRFHHVQLVDLYTHNFGYLQKRPLEKKGDRFLLDVPSPNGGTFMLAGPNWKGMKLPDVDTLLHCETQFAHAIYRTQLSGPDDLVHVKGIQARYSVQPLSDFVRWPSPAVAETIDWPKPEPRVMTQTPAMFRYLNFLLRFAPAHPSELQKLARFEKIGIGAAKPFDEGALGWEFRRALENGIADGMSEYEHFRQTQIDTGKIRSGELSGTREQLTNNYLYRHTAAQLDLHGNSPDEVLSVDYFEDASDLPLDGARLRYVLKFKKDTLPPVRAFWSVTLYDARTQLLFANPLNRYRINSMMLPQLQLGAGGDLILFVQHDAPEHPATNNWLPAPAGPFFLKLRLYEPKVEAVSGTWRAPRLTPDGADENRA